MAYDEALAGRIRKTLAERPSVVERRMFGGLAFMLSGHMACGVIGDRLMLRLGADGTEAALGEPHVLPMDFTGRPSDTMVYVEAAGVAGAEALGAWIQRAAAFVETLPARQPPA